MMSFRSVVFSLVFHALVLAFLVNREPLDLSPSRAPITVEVLDSEDLKKISREKTLVLQADPAPELLSEDDTPARFMSEKTQRVKKETRAAQTGLTENRMPSLKALTKTSNPLMPKAPTQRELKASEDSSGLAVRKSRKDLRPNLSESSKLPLGASRINESLQDQVSVGEFTALNTDQYLYYSFYARVANQLRYRWETRVHNAMGTVVSRNISIPRRDKWVTELTVYLDRGGNFVRAQTNRESGVELFDSAAREAFEAGAPYMNPPKELVGADGFIRLKYSFAVHWTPVQMVRRNPEF